MGRAIAQRGKVRDEFLRSLMKGDDQPGAQLDLNEAVLSAIAMAEREVARRALIITRLDKNVQVFGNAHQLVEMFVDLLIDAANAFPQYDPSNVIVVTSERVGDCVVVRVGDNAAGARPLIFVIAEDCVAEHEGHLHVEADPVQGSVVAIVLPHARLYL